ncbi:MAG: PDZ domain-containing protein, partial [Candidatus Hydrogenedentales bacterium]
LSDDYETIATQVDVRVAEDEQGNVLGLTADNVEGIPTADMLGLQNNDILTSINNQPVDSVEAVVEILNKYRTAQTFRLNILRGGQRQTLTYSLK